MKNKERLTIKERGAPYELRAYRDGPEMWILTGHKNAEGPRVFLMSSQARRLRDWLTKALEDGKE